MIERIRTADIPHRGPDFGAVLSVTPGIPLAQALQSGLVRVGQMQPHASLSRDVQHMKPHAGVKHPACRWRLATLALVVWKGRAVRWERTADAGLSGRIDEQADGHPPPQGHETFRFVALER
jgi:hypothetical protein